jgi:hypothetical protein
MLTPRPRSSRSRWCTVVTVLVLSIWPISSWNGAITANLGCCSWVETSCGNHSRTSSTHLAALIDSPPGWMPASRAAAVYLRTVLRSTPRLRAISEIGRPACQWTRISVMSTTLKVLLANLLLPPAGLRRSDRRSGRAEVMDSVNSGLVN